MAKTERGFSIHIFLPDGTPDGLKIIEKSNWTGCGIVCPRVLLSEYKSRPEFTRTSVYLLLGHSEEFDMPKIYVGESDSIRQRLETHVIKKEFWETVIFFTSKDENLNKAHIKHLESRLIRLAAEAKRCELDNSTQPDLPPLSEADKSAAEGFLDEMLLCFPVLGLQVFEKPKVKESTAQLLSIKSKGIQAKGFESAQGFVVCAGSGAVMEEVPSCHTHVIRLRKKLVQKNVLESNGASYRLTQDYVFNSPSTAAAVMLGRTANGRKKWKDKNGRTLAMIQDAEATA